MNWNKTLLFVTFFSFLFMGSTGLLMFFSFSGDVFSKTWGLNKNQWLDIHMIFAILTFLLVSYHVATKWEWIEKYILRQVKSKPNREIISRRRNNTWMMILFTFTASSGLLSWLAGNDCPQCLKIHPYLGMGLWLVFLFHVYKHREYLRKK